MNIAEEFRTLSREARPAFIAATKEISHVGWDYASVRMLNEASWAIWKGSVIGDMIQRKKEDEFRAAFARYRLAGHE